METDGNKTRCERYKDQSRGVWGNDNQVFESRSVTVLICPVQVAEQIGQQPVCNQSLGRQLRKTSFWMDFRP